MSDLDYREQHEKIVRPKLLLTGEGWLVLQGLKGQQQKHISKLSEASRDAFAEAYALAGYKYCIDNNINKTKAQIKNAYKNLGSE